MRSFRILIVDDEVFNCELLEMYLDLFGHEVVTAFSGSEALARLDSSIDLILMDVNMPSMTGYETVERIRGGAECADVPIIMVTALNSQEDRLKAVRSGAGDYINKPVDEVELRVRIDAQLRLKQAQDALKQHQEQLEQLVQERTRELEARSQELEEKNREIQAANAVMENAVEGIAQMDEAGRFAHVNLALAEMFGYTPLQMVGMHWEQVIASAQQEAYRLARQQMRARGKAEIETEGRHQDGSSLFVQVVFVAAVSPAGVSGDYYCFIKDIRERKAFEAKITYQAFHDALTGLANRLQFMNDLDFAQAHRRRDSRPLTVMFLDLDNFKAINDTLGHEAGDHMLITVAQRLKACVGPGDTVARLAGDEFSLLLENLETTQAAVDLAERLLQQLQQPILIQDRQVCISVSIGIAHADESCVSGGSLLRDADLAMYHAKMRGKSGYSIFDQAINDTLSERMEIEADLRSAVEKEQIRVYYQPLVDLETGHFAGVEALVRWEHPTRGLLLPGQFTGIAEETGAIIPIGFWVLDEACRQAKEWESLLPPEQEFTVSVNISGKQLQQANVVSRVRQALDKSGLAPSKLKLEITESVMMADMESAIQKMYELKEWG